jgi:hypothetical protein
VETSASNADPDYLCDVWDLSIKVRWKHSTNGEQELTNQDAHTNHASAATSGPGTSFRDLLVAQSSISKHYHRKAIFPFGESGVSVCKVEDVGFHEVKTRREGLEFDAAKGIIRCEVVSMSVRCKDTSKIETHHLSIASISASGPCDRRIWSQTAPRWWS